MLNYLIPSLHRATYHGNLCFQHETTTFFKYLAECRCSTGQISQGPTCTEGDSDTPSSQDEMKPDPVPTIGDDHTILDDLEMKCILDSSNLIVNTFWY